MKKNFSPVMPAEAGIHFCFMASLDSRMRGKESLSGASYQATQVFLATATGLKHIVT
jgi:hypothetical protein